MTNAEGMTKHKAQSSSDEHAFWEVDTLPVVREERDSVRVYDLEERTAKFGEAII